MKTCFLTCNACVAQEVEQHSLKVYVMGSIPVAGTIVGVLKNTLIRSGRTYSVVMLDAGGIANDTIWVRPAR